MTLAEILNSDDPAAKLQEAIEQHERMFNHNSITAFDYRDQAHIWYRRTKVKEMFLQIQFSSVD